MKNSYIYFAFFIIAFLLGFFFSFLIPNTYRSDATLDINMDVIGRDVGSSSLQGLVGGSGISSLLGSSMGSRDEVAIAIEQLKSKKFISKFLEKDNRLQILFASSGFKDGFIYDENIYDPVKNEWTREPNFYGSRYPIPIEMQKELFKKLAISKDPNTGLIIISFKSFSPEYSQKFLNNFILEFNEYKRQIELNETETAIDYLEEKLVEIKNLEIRESFLDMVENELSGNFFAQTVNEYFFKIIDPPHLPENKTEPSRLMYAVLFGLIGIMASFFFIRFKDKSN